jgi:hypothetical protein
VAEAGSLWTLAGFIEGADAWIERDNPDDDLRVIVLDWIFGRCEDPYRGVRRESGFPNLWYGVVPGSRRGATAVMCSYWIVETERLIRGESIATLGLPI